MSMRRLILGLLALATASVAWAQSFTYQGFLRQGGNPANGTFSMTFTLFNHPTNTGAGAQVGSPITLNNVSVQNGLFTVELNFGSVWDGSDRWLEIQVGSTTLSPRVKLNPTPYAAYALRPWRTAGSHIYYDEGTVGIGAYWSDPNYRLNVVVPPSDNRSAIRGYTSAQSGAVYGVVGGSGSRDGAGVYGIGSEGTGVKGTSFTLGVFGWHNYGSGFGEGVSGRSDSSAGRGVTGLASAASGSTYGVFGQSESVSGTGVYGVAAATSGVTFGIRGKVNSISGYAGYFEGRGYFSDSVGIGTTAPAARLSLGGDDANTKLALWQGTGAGEVMGFGIAPNQFRLHLHHSGNRFSFLNAPDGSELVTILGNGNVGIGTTAPSYPLHVRTTGGDRAIYGVHTASTGNTVGVYGRSDSKNGIGVFGHAPTISDVFSTPIGVMGRSDNVNGYGVYGYSTTTTDDSAPIGVYGTHVAPRGYGVYSLGRFAASGTKDFQIDHPLRPETHYLNHFCFEGPEPQNIYNGVVVLDARGEAWVQLPDYFESINRDPRYTLTPVGAPMPNLHVAVELQGNRFKIAGGAPGKKVSWEVKAIRNDLWVQRYGYQTEQEKGDAIKGKYLHPELYGQPKERGIHYRPELERLSEGEKP